jgi:hypothetical protein
LHIGGGNSILKAGLGANIKATEEANQAFLKWGTKPNEYDEKADAFFIALQSSLLAAASQFPCLACPSCNRQPNWLGT